MTQVWDKENNPSPWQELNPWPPKHQVGTLSTELQEFMKVFAKNVFSGHFGGFQAESRPN